MIFIGKRCVFKIRMKKYFEYLGVLLCLFHDCGHEGAVQGAFVYGVGGVF